MVDQEEIRRLFGQALELGEPARRPFVEREARDSAVRREVLQLLAHHQDESTLLARPAAVAYPRLAGREPRTVAEFELRLELGGGGMGVVYLAQDTVLERPVALKLLRPEVLRHPGAVERFHQEAKAAGRLSHPNIVQVYRYGAHEDRYYIAMEYVEGQTLAARIADRSTVFHGAGGSDGNSGGGSSGGERSDATGPAYWTECTLIVSKVADALEEAHAADVVHRDVKPSNILLDKRDAPRLTDFGIAKVLSEDPITRTGDFPGTPSYMSPEQVTPQIAAVDGRSDVFSLGVVLYEMLALRRPFVGESPMQIMEAIRVEDPASLRRVNPAIPRDLRTICEKALEKKPTDRYQTAGHMAADLRSVLQDRPILARPPGLLRRARRWIGRHRAPAVALAFVVLAASTARLGYGYRSAWREARAVLDLTANVSDANVVIQAFDQEALTLGEPVNLGTIPLTSFYLEPGQYRITVKSPDGQRFAELQHRFAAGQAHDFDLGLRATTEVEVDMMLFPGGDFTVAMPGHPADGRTVLMEPFLLDKCEVSNGDYRAFVEATGHRKPDHWERFGYDEALADHPVINVTQEDAEAYARWAGKRLPTALEWQYAARYPDGRRYPWGNDLADADPALEPSCEVLRAAQTVTADDMYSFYSEHTVAANSDSPRASNGLCQIYGNVREFTTSIDRTSNHGPIVMGRCWIDLPEGNDLTASWVRPTLKPSYRTGFRCAKSGAGTR